MAATLSGSSSFRRLPALPSQEMPKGLAEPPTRQSSKQPTVNRYRNDPYRIAAVMPQPPPAAPQPGPQPPMDGHGPTRPHIHIPLPSPAPDCGDKIVAGPRRGRPLPNRNTALPHLNNQPHLQPGSGNPSQPSSHRGSRQNSVTRASVAAPPPTVPVAPAAGPAGAVAPRPSAGTSATAAEEAAVAPAGNAARGASKIALIQFKRTMMSALYDAVAFADLGVGDAVIVEGDRGEHIATIARVNVRKSKSTPTMIVRRATAADHQQHMRVKEDEAIALQTCRSHAERLGLNDVMTIVDVEFQLDFQKLTVFFQARDPSSFVDFRSLQRALYQHFRCRIWIVDC